MSRSKALALVGLLAVAGSGLTLAVAQGGPTRATKLHEDIKVPATQLAKTSERLGRGVPIIGPKPAARQNPTAIASQDKLLPEPTGENKAAKGEPVHGKGGFGADRQTEAKADYLTGADSELHYIEVFNPSIVPFKRMSALDSVRDDYTLVTSSAALADIGVGGEPTAGHDLFWASVMVELSPGVDVPIPSVAPDMRILSYETTPATSLVFSKDFADNYYLRTDESGSAGSYRVIFLSEASPKYFAPSVPRNMRVRDIPASKLAPMPDDVRRVADGVLDEMRLHKNMQVDEVLDKLVFYFRSFDAKAPPPRSGNIYLDLYNSQAGVCRHRSFAFMITANALGLPTRYLSNEAHAWVEVWLPGEDWMRIDLGGSASTLNVSNASDKSMYRPRGEDPFAKPESYEENYTQLEGDVKGLREDQIAERQKPYAGDDGEGEGNGSFFGEGEGEAGDSDLPPEDDGPLIGPGSDLPEESEEASAGKLSTRAIVTSAATEGFRGESVKISASISDSEGRGLPGLVINVMIAPAGNEGNDPHVLGKGLSDDNGLMTLSVELPTDLATQDYEVFVSFNGNKTYGSSVSQ